MYSLLSENLRRTSRLNLKGYNMKQLVQLNKISFANKNINAGLRHSLILTINGEIYGCGYNEFGQLGLGNYSNRNTPILLSNNITQISVGGQHSIILTDNKQIFVLGYIERIPSSPNYKNRSQKLILNINDSDQITDGDTHSMILTNYGKIYVFGDNHYNQLGLGDNMRRDRPTLMTK